MNIMNTSKVGRYTSKAQTFLIIHSSFFMRHLINIAMDNCACDLIILEHGDFSVCKGQFRNVTQKDGVSMGFPLKKMGFA